MNTKHNLGKGIAHVAMVISIYLVGGAQAAEVEYVDFQCNETSKTCSVGSGWLTYGNTPVGDPLDVDIIDDNLQFIQLVGSPRQPATMVAAFGIWNGGWLPDDILSSLPDIGFEATLDLIGKDGQLLTAGLMQKTGTVEAGIIHMTSSEPVRVASHQVYGVRVHVETTCLGDPLTTVPCQDFHTFVGGPNMNGPVRFHGARIGSERVPGDVNGDFILSAEDIDLISTHVGTNAEAFDLNDDRQVTESDRELWVHEYAKTHFGDADLNKEVNFADFLALADSFGGPGGWKKGDFDGNGFVEFPDFLRQSRYFGRQVASVPEPSSAMLLLVGAGLLFGRCYHREFTPSGVAN